MHAESIALYAVTIALAWRARSTDGCSPTGSAMLAALLYALDPGHGMPVEVVGQPQRTGRPSPRGSRHSLAHDRWRRDGWRPGAVLGPLAFATALSGSEMGMGSDGLSPLAHAVTLDRAGRFRALMPYVGIEVVWLLIYRHLGYGVRGSGLYVDPVSDAVRFALGALVYLARLIAPSFSGSSPPLRPTYGRSSPRPECIRSGRRRPSRSWGG